MNVRVRVLGTFEVEGLDARALGSRKARTLLKILALARGRPVAADRLIDCLWGDAPPARPAEQVSVLASRLRGAIGADRLPRTDAGYALVADWLDVDAMVELTDEAARRLEAGSPALALAAADAAVAVARGPLLDEDMDADWAQVDRATAARTLARARLLAARAALALGDVLGSADMAEAVLGDDPYDEVALRLAMVAHAAAGRPASALALFARSRDRLVEDLGVGPTPETEELHTSILREDPLDDLLPPSVRPRRSGGSAPTELPGRHAELASMAAIIGEAKRGGVHVVVVEGDAGIGKSGLLQATAAAAVARGATVLTARCDDVGLALPMQPLLDAVDDYLRLLAPKDVAELLAGEARVLAPLLRFSGLDDADVVAAEPALGLTRPFAALLTLLDRVATAQPPVVLVIDDFHVAGVATADWVRFAHGRTSTGGIVVIAARRPGEGLALEADRTIVLGPIDREAAGLIVGPDLAAALHERSGGNPLFLIELAGAPPGDALPASVRESVAARCDRAGPAAAATLRTAALLGRDLDVDVLAGVLHLAPVELLDHLEDGARRQFLVEGPGGFAFRHDLVREALAAGCGPSRRALVHREAARVLSGRPHVDPLQVAWHARLGGDDQLAASALMDAAALASRHYDHAEAERFLDQALELDDSAPARLHRARARVMRRAYHDAAEDARAAIALGGGAPAFELASEATYFARDFASAARLADDGVRLADDGDLRAALLVHQGRARHASGAVAAAIESFDAIVATRGEIGVASRVFRRFALVHQGHARAAVESFEVPGPTETRFPFVASYAFFVKGYGEALLGRPVAAFDAFDAFDAEAVRINVDRFAGRSDNFRGWILRNLGQLEEADERNADGLAAAAAIGYAEAQAQGLLDLADGRLRAADLDGARRFLDLADAVWGEHAFRWRHELRSRLLRARVALGAGEVDDARSAAIMLVEDAAAAGLDRYVVLAALLSHRAALLLGDPLDATAIEGLLESLDAVAGLESWWLTAEMAQTAGVDEWWSWAERRVAALASESGRWADAFVAYAATRLDRMRTGNPIG